jgi:hypothetical protein
MPLFMGDPGSAVESSQGFYDGKSVLDNKTCMDGDQTPQYIVH